MEPIRDALDTGLPRAYTPERYRQKCATVTELAHHDQLHPDQITAWNAQLVERALQAFGAEAAGPEPSPIVKELHARIGRPAMQTDLVRSARQGGHAARRAMIDNGPTSCRWRHHVLRRKAHGFPLSGMTPCDPATYGHGRIR
jgi:hypothetical protein